MKVLTRSRRITTAVKRVLRRLPGSVRLTVEDFLDRVVAVKEWEMLGFSDFDRSCAITGPLYRNLGPMGQPGTDYGCQVRFNLPIVRLFSDRALIGIVAHEFAHIHIAATRLGAGWHEAMKRDEAANELAADRLARRWGFDQEIARMHHERKARVNPILDERGSAIMQQIYRLGQAQNDRARAALEGRQG
jgi:hypothetical protein